MEEVADRTEGAAADFMAVEVEGVSREAAVEAASMGAAGVMAAVAGVPMGAAASMGAVPRAADRVDSPAEVFAARSRAALLA